MEKFVFAADIGGTKIAVARVSASGGLAETAEASTPSSGGKAAVAALIGQLERLNADGACAVAVDVPGLARSDGTVWAPNIRGWRRMPLRRILQRHFRLPVLIESDRDAFLAGEVWRGAAQNSRNAICLMVGTGIGAGIMVDGRLLRGAGGLAGAVGWMAIRDGYRPIYRKVGCLEAHAAGPAIERAALSRLGERISVSELARMARGGDLRAQRLLREAGEALGLGLANLVSTLNPEIVIVAGGVSAAGDLLLRAARRAMLRWGQPLAVKRVRIVRSRLGGQAPLLGMARLALDTLNTS